MIFPNIYEKKKDIQIGEHYEVLIKKLLKTLPVLKKKRTSRDKQVESQKLWYQDNRKAELKKSKNRYWNNVEKSREYYRLKRLALKKKREKEWREKCLKKQKKIIKVK